jgi:hypothetical protein
MYSSPLFSLSLSKAQPSVFLTTLRLLALVLALAAQTIICSAAEPSAPVHEINGSFIKDWLVLGPFPSKAMEIDLLEAAGGEANVRPKEGDTVRTRDGKVLTWKRLQSKYDLVNLEQAFGGQEWAIAYAYCELDSANSAETDIRAHANEAAVLWVNGQVAGPISYQSLGIKDVSTTLPVHLTAGHNACLLKLKQEEYEWQFMIQPLPPARAVVNLHVIDADQHPAANALVELYDQGDVAGRLRTDAHGMARACLYPCSESYDISATSGDAGAWLYHFAPSRGSERDLGLRLGKAVSVSGRVLALDGSPQNAITVQAMPISNHIVPSVMEKDGLKPGMVGVPKLPPFSAVARFRQWPSRTRMAIFVL